MSSNNEPTSGSSAHLPTAHSTADLRSPSKEEADDAVGIGHIIDGRYRITAKLGEGGMGEVYAAEHVHIAKKVAMKLLRSEILSNKEAVQRFYQEARSASSIGHENIIGIEDFGTLPDGRIYLCMELLDGQPLNDMLEQPIDPERILDILIQTCHGLAAAHAKNIVHRDMKPENIFVTHTADGRDVPKLLDFGIAKVQGNDGDNNLTKTGTIFGTPYYMAPEQALGQGIDQRADVYAMGVIMYEIFAGSVPFQGESFMGILTKHITTEPEPPAQRAAQNGKQLVPGVAEVIIRAMKKEPEDRYQTMDELTQDLVSVRRQFVGAGMSAYMEPHQAMAVAAGMSGGYSGPVPGPGSGPMAPARTPTPFPTPPASTSQEGMPAIGSGQMAPYPGDSGALSAGYSAVGAVPGASSSSMYAMPEKSSKVGVIAAIFLVLIVGGGIAGFVLLSGDKKKKNDEVAATTGGTDTTGAVDTAGNPGTDTSGTDNSGSNTAGTDNSGTDNSGTDNSGTDNSGTDNSGTVITPTAEMVTVMVLSRPDSVTLYRDGEKLGRTPFNVEVVPGQPVELTLKKRKYRDKKVTLDGKSERVKIKMSRKPGSKTNPSGNSGDDKTGSLGLGLEG